MNILKFLHVVSVFFWVGTLLTLTRLISKQGRLDLFKKTYFLIDLPFMCAAVITGLLLLFLKSGINFLAPWLHMKLTFAFVLIICDLILLSFFVGKRKSEGVVGYKVLYWIVVITLLTILAAIYILKPNFQ